MYDIIAHKGFWLFWVITLDLNDLATNSVAGGTIVVIAFARVDALDGPGAPSFVIMIRSWILWPDAAA